MWFQEYIDKYVDTLIFDPEKKMVSWVLNGICTADSITNEVLSAYCRRSPERFHSSLFRHDDGNVRVSDIYSWAMHASKTHDILMTTIGRYQCCTMNISLHPCEPLDENVIDELREDCEDVTMALMNADNSRTMNKTYVLLRQLPGRLTTNEPYMGFPVAPKAMYRNRDKYIETLVFDLPNNTVSWMQDGICTADSVTNTTLREYIRNHPHSFHAPELSGEQEVGVSELFVWATLSDGERDPFRMHILTSKVGELVFCTLSVILHPVDETNVVDPILDDWNQVKQFVHEANQKKTLVKNLQLLLTFPGYDETGERSF
jgi:hypothetical protein